MLGRENEEVGHTISQDGGSNIIGKRLLPTTFAQQCGGGKMPKMGYGEGLVGFRRGIIRRKFFLWV